MRRTLFGTLIIALMSAPSAWAASIVIGDPITVQLINNGIGYADPLTANVNVSAGNEVFEGDGSEIGGSAGSGPMLDGEFINVSTTSIVFSIYGGGPDVAGGGATTTGYGAGAHYLLTGLVDPALGLITGGSLLLNNIVGVTIGNQVLIGPHSVQLYLDTLGVVFDGIDNIGTITINLTFQDASTPPNVVPEPATLVLVGSGAVLAWRRRRSRPARI
jgi:hypothetical protein